MSTHSLLYHWTLRFIPLLVVLLGSRSTSLPMTGWFQKRPDPELSLHQMHYRMNQIRHLSTLRQSRTRTA